MQQALNIQWKKHYNVKLTMSFIGVDNKAEEADKDESEKVYTLK